MNHVITQLPAHQRGALYATVILLVLVGTVITATLKIVPAYNNDNIVQSAMETIVERADYKTMSISDIRKEVARSLQVNRVENFNTENVKLTREAGKDYIDVVYETRVPMVANISAVVAFSKRYDKF
jgi:sorbitol-specific phosphotransferase system component IIBC